MPLLKLGNFIWLQAFSKIEGTSLPFNFYEAVAYQNIKGDSADGYLLEDIGTQLVNGKCANFTPLLDKIAWLDRSIKEDALIDSDNNSSAFYADYDQGSEDSGTSSLDRWNRFRDVEMDDGTIFLAYTYAVNVKCIVHIFYVLSIGRWLQSYQLR